MSALRAVSVIIPVYRADVTLPRVLAALQPQVGAESEVVIVDSSGLEHAARLERAYPWVRVIGLPHRVLPGKARNIGARAAGGSWLGFLDADAVPGSAWLAALRARADDGVTAAVAGAVDNGTPRNAVGTASYLLEFSEWVPSRRGSPGHAASCNLLMARSAFDAAGGFCEDIWPGEDTVLTVPLAQATRLAFAPDAVVWHLNRTRLKDLLWHQYRLGRSFVAVCERVDFPHRRFSRWPLLTVAPVLRVVALGPRLVRDRALVTEALRAGGLLALGLAAWTVGVAVAAAKSTDAFGRSVQRLARAMQRRSPATNSSVLSSVQAEPRAVDDAVAVGAPHAKGGAPPAG